MVEWAVGKDIEVEGTNSICGVLCFLSFIFHKIEIYVLARFISSKMSHLP